MKKKLNTDVISSELSGRSAFFPGYKNDTEKTSRGHPANRSPDRPTGRRTDDSTERPPDRT